MAAVAKDRAKQSLTKVTKKPPKKRRKSCKQSYSTYMYGVLTQVHPSTRISSKVNEFMNSFIVDIFERVASKALHLTHHNKCCTISATEIQSTVCLILPGELAKHTVSEGMKAVTKYTNSV
ncbi:histone H2B type 2-E-like [Carcharodon carcharias]|uniref:histone H2B type 2-E-like n=1 Tax=Carcharodon carcharias TaxID=13397 RepID=UPI001B7E4066|nr:histone H2B type 2-E-like [Carcharodon carcharias]